VTSRTAIEFSWSDGESDGGAAVIDYRIMYDQTIDVWAELESNVLGQTYSTTITLTPGRYYKFKVMARNSVGYSEMSEEIVILAAQLPARPLAPTTTLVGENMRVSWLQPDDGGTPLLAYRVVIQQGDGVFVEQLVHCDGSDATIMVNQYCLLPS
jgi:hypothetical protein